MIARKLTNEVEDLRSYLRSTSIANRLDKSVPEIIHHWGSGDNYMSWMKKLKDGFSPMKSRSINDVASYIVLVTRRELEYLSLPMFASNNDQGQQLSF